MKNKHYYILLILCFLTNAIFASSIQKDTLTVDTSSFVKKRHVVKKIKEKYSGRDFIYVETAKDKSQNAWQRFTNWLSRGFEKLFNIDSPKTSKLIVKRIMQILGILLIIFVIYKIISSYMNNDGYWIFGRKSDKLSINAIDVEEDIHHTNFETLIENALIEKDFRLAIRYNYLLVLKHLSEKEKIIWDNEKTNYDYYQEIKNKDLKKQFQYISYIYDYCWYGEFKIENNEYKSGEFAFNKLINSI